MLQSQSKVVMDKKMEPSDKISDKSLGTSRDGNDDCRDSLSKNLPIRDDAQNSDFIAPNTRSCQKEFPTEQKMKHTSANQRILPRHSSPKMSSMTLQPSQERFSKATNGHNKNKYNYQQQQQHNIERTPGSGIYPVSRPTTQGSSSDTTIMKDEPEVDTRDTESSRMSSLPLHRVLEVESQSAVEDHLAQIAAAERIPKENRGDASLQHTSHVPSAPASPTMSTPPGSPTKSAPSLWKRNSSRKHKKLTLSAYRKPEETIRLTECDASRHLENEYNLRASGCKIIGHGAFSTVRSALRNTDGTKVAIKSISKFDALRARRFRRPKGSKHMDEWEIMKLLRSNPYVLTLYDVFETEEEIHLVTEFCSGGELFDAIKLKSTQRSSFRRGRFSESQAARITNQILKALVELHDLGIVHRDIKAENILLLNSDESDIQVKLCDFGMARLHRRQTSAPDITSDGEASPSTPGLLFGHSANAPPEGCHGSCIGPATDIYSLGVTLYILLCGFPPVFCDNVIEFPEAYWDDISEEAKDIVRSMLHHDPQQRISAKDALNNVWINQDTNSLRRSISVNLELVRARLLRSLGDASQNGNGKRRGFGNTNSPNKRSRISSLDLSLNALYDCPVKRDIRVIEERVESRAISGEGRGQGMTCS